MRKKVSIFLITFLIIGILSACSDLRIKLPDIQTLSEGIEALTRATATPKPTDTIPPTQSNQVQIPGLSDLQSAYEQIYEMVLPSVVSINVTSTITDRLPSIPDLPFDFEFPDQELPRQYQQQGAGSGFIWDKQGHIITNNHVIEGASIIRVRFSDGTSVLGEVIGADSDSDLAVIKVNVPQDLLNPVEITDSTQVKVGQIAIAIGNPFQLDGSMTVGIISGTGRSLVLGSTDSSGLSYSIPDVIQTDAAINPGNSGGVLVDINGKLLGVTTAIESPVRANSGIGYVVPSVIVQKVVPVLIEEGDYDHPWIGISGHDLIPEFTELMDLPEGQRGALIIEVTPDSPADQAGLIGSDKEAQIDGQGVRVGGDVITAVDNQPIEDFEDLVAFLARYAYVDQTIDLTVKRDGKTIQVPLTLAARPKEITERIEEPKEILTGAWLGITGADLTDESAEAMDLDRKTRGVLIQQITAGSPADEAGLRGSYKPFDMNGKDILIGGDIITAVDDADINNMSQLSQIISESSPGDKVTVAILRDGKKKDINIVLGEKPQ